MTHIEVAPGTTFCPDTPENWRHFGRLKEALLNPGKVPKTIQAQIARENKRLRSLRAFLPGYEPDR